jgi:SAM-dependent methyltransferase
MPHAECRRHLACATLLGCAILTATSVAQPHLATSPLTWNDLAPAGRDRLTAAGITPAAFPSYRDRLRETHARRVREGDLDHLVFYLLQSTTFTTLPPIEPALSAKALVDGLADRERDAFLHGSEIVTSRVPNAVRARAAALVRALDGSDRDPRLVYFRELVHAAVPVPHQRDAALLREYLRVMRFVYDKEFVAQRSASAPQAVAELYRSRGLSTDTAVEAGYLVYLGLGVVKSLEPERRVRRVLIVGPGLDLAPRTGLLEAGPPESYQPWAVIDALIALGLSRPGDLEVVAADINPRVVSHLRHAHAQPPALRLITGLPESDTVAFSAEYRDYFSRLGRAIDAAPADASSTGGHLIKVVRVSPSAARALRAETLDVVTDRLETPPFDVVIATNVLTYFDDIELALALTGIARMLAPGGVFLHNEARPIMGELTAPAGLAFEQSRQAIIATVRGAPPLGDTVWIHRKARP